MIVRNGAGLALIARMFLLRNVLAIALILLIEIVISEIHMMSPGVHTTVFSASAVAMLATVVGIFLVFSFNHTYQRWWEARILWGQLVNTSRNFGRQVVSLLQAERLTGELSELELGALRRRLVYRQIAFVNALRLRLRQEEDLDCLTTLLSEEDFSQVMAAQNRPQAILQQQVDDLLEQLGPETAQTVLLGFFDQSLNLLTDVQGGCERIKNTAFPPVVRTMSTVFVWGLAALIPAVFLEPDQAIYPVEFVAVLFICMSFIVVKQLGQTLADPFEGQPSDTPMTALCRTIERDLREQLGESELPPAIEPHRGVLM